MNRDQMIQALEGIRDELVRQSAAPSYRHPRTSLPVPVRSPQRSRAVTGAQAAKRQALAIVRAVLDDWIKGAKEDHKALGHRHENKGEECWRTFAPSDIRNMINDAAQKLGVDEIPLPEVAEENKR